LLQVVQIIGAFMILIAFGLAQAHRLNVLSVTYLLLNLAGSALLAISAIVETQWGFIILESAWAAISGWGLVRLLPGRTRKAS
jgi:hypothetical protein